GQRAQWGFDEIHGPARQRGTAERRQRSDAEVGEKSEQPDSSGDEGEPGRRDPSERRERRGMPVDAGTWTRLDERWLRCRSRKLSQQNTSGQRHWRAECFVNG